MRQLAPRREPNKGAAWRLSLSTDGRRRALTGAVHVVAVASLAWVAPRYSWTALLSPWVVLWLALLVAASYRCGGGTDREGVPNHVGAAFTVKCAIMALFNPLVATVVIALGGFDWRDMRSRGLAGALSPCSRQAACAALGAVMYRAALWAEPAGPADLRVATAMAASGTVFFILNAAGTRAAVAMRAGERFWDKHAFRGELVGVHLTQVGLAIMLVLVVRQDPLLGAIILAPLWCVGTLLVRPAAHSGAREPRSVPSNVAVHLTPRERQVLSLVGQGRANKQIALAHGISIHTVERHVANIYEKAGIQGRAEATLLALRLGLLEP